MSFIEFFVFGTSPLTECACDQIKKQNPLIDAEAKALDILLTHPIHQKQQIDFWDDKLVKSIIVLAAGIVVAGVTYLAASLLAPWLAKAIIVTALGMSLLGLHRAYQALEKSTEIEKNRYSEWNLASEILKDDSQKMLSLWESYAKAFFVDMKKSFNIDTYSKQPKNEQNELLVTLIQKNPFRDHIIDRIYQKDEFPAEIQKKYDLFCLFANSLLRPKYESSPYYLKGCKKAALREHERERTSNLEFISKKLESLKTNSEQNTKIFDFAKNKINTYYDEKNKEVENYTVDVFNKIEKHIPSKVNSLIDLLSTQNLNVGIDQVKSTICIKGIGDLCPSASFSYGTRLEDFSEDDIIKSGIAKETWEEFFARK